MADKLVIDREQVALGTPGYLAFDHGRAKGSSWTAVKIRLDASSYATGGFYLKPEVTRMSRVWDLYQMAYYDVHHRVIQPNGYQAVLNPVSQNSGSDVKLQIFFNGVEMADNTSAPAGKFIWVIFRGQR